VGTAAGGVGLNKTKRIKISYQWAVNYSYRVSILAAFLLFVLQNHKILIQTKGLWLAAQNVIIYNINNNNITLNIIILPSRRWINIIKIPLSPSYRVVGGVETDDRKSRRYYVAERVCCFRRREIGFSRAVMSCQKCSETADLGFTDLENCLRWFIFVFCFFLQYFLRVV